MSFIHKVIFILKVLPKKFLFFWNLSALYQDDIGFYNSVREHNAQFIERLDEKIGERTMTHADIHFKTSSQVIVIGRYRGKDFVKAYPIENDSLNDIINIMKRMESNSHVGRIDMPSTMSFSALYKKDRF